MVDTAMLRSWMPLSRTSKGTWRTPTEEISKGRCLTQAVSVHTEGLSERRVLEEAVYENPIYQQAFVHMPSHFGSTPSAHASKSTFHGLGDDIRDVRI